MMKDDYQAEMNQIHLRKVVKDQIKKNVLNQEATGRHQSRYILVSTLVIILCISIGAYPFDHINRTPTTDQVIAYQPQPLPRNASGMVEPNVTVKLDERALISANNLKQLPAIVNMRNGAGEPFHLLDEQEMRTLAYQYQAILGFEVMKEEVRYYEKKAGPQAGMKIADFFYLYGNGIKLEIWSDSRVTFVFPPDTLKGEVDKTAFLKKIGWTNPTKNAFEEPFIQYYDRVKNKADAIINNSYMSAAIYEDKVDQRITLYNTTKPSLLKNYDLISEKAAKKRLQEGKYYVSICCMNHYHYDKKMKIDAIGIEYHTFGLHEEYVDQELVLEKGIDIPVYVFYVKADDGNYMRFFVPAFSEKDLKKLGGTYEWFQRDALKGKN